MVPLVGVSRFGLRMGDPPPILHQEGRQLLAGGASGEVPTEPLAPRSAMLRTPRRRFSGAGGEAPLPPSSAFSQAARLRLRRISSVPSLRKAARVADGAADVVHAAWHRAVDLACKSSQGVDLAL